MKFKQNSLLTKEYKRNKKNINSCKINKHYINFYLYNNINTKKNKIYI